MNRNHSLDVGRRRRRRRREKKPISNNEVEQTGLEYSIVTVFGVNGVLKELPC
jgi:hypothetical protein